jgi:ubiquitin-conjugating enzyme E2 Q
MVTVGLNYHADVGDYPTLHQYFIYTNSENVPPEITAALSDFDIYAGLKVSQVLTKIVKLLDKTTAGSHSNPVCIDDDPMDMDSPPEADDSEQEFEEEDEEDEETVSDGFFDDEPGFRAGQFQNSTAAYPGKERRTSGYVGSAEYKARIRSDLREVKKAGFHIGHYGPLFEGKDCFLVISIRIAKLGVPEDALKAWHLEETEYVLLLIHYLDGYKTLEELLALPSGASPSIQMRVGICQEQKTCWSETISTFTQTNRKDRRQSAPLTAQSDDKSQEVSDDATPASATCLRRLFIGEPLKHLLEDRLVKLLRYRTALAVSWAGAEAYYNDHQGRSHMSSEGLDNKYWAPDTDDSHLPKVVTSDHLLSKSPKISFPLLAVQFFLRHLVRCTEFCLVCHCRIEAEWEALMPYVCDKPLCLYQYMALGFGPSIEYTILTQPYVVDLLISFCYASASAGVLTDFPVGMGLTVPNPSLISGTIVMPTQHVPHTWSTTTASLVPANNKTMKMSYESQTHKALFDETNEELIFPMDVKPLRVGQWICLLPFPRSEVKQHRRVLETFYPNVRLGPPIAVSRGAKPEQDHYHSYIDARSTKTHPREPTPAATPQASSPQFSSVTAPFEVQFLLYDQNFDDLSTAEKLSCIRMLLDTLPSVMEMRSYLQSNGHKHTTLESLSERLPVASLGVLRWVIASNRSCIVQIDGLDNIKNRSEDRVPGMQQYMQFRFAQVCSLLP